MRFLKNIRYGTRAFLGGMPAASNLLHLDHRQNRGKFVSKNCDLCIEGFPRSGNSFFVNYVVKFNPDLEIAHHKHVPCQIWEAEKFHKPSIVLIRNPLDAISSLIVADPRLSARLAIRSYIDFYEKIQRCSEWLLADFTGVTNSPFSVLEKTNTRFQTQLCVGHLDEIVKQDIFDRLRKWHSAQSFRRNLLPIPSEDRNALQNEIRSMLSKDRLIREALNIYEYLVGTK